MLVYVYSTTYVNANDRIMSTEIEGRFPSQYFLYFKTLWFMKCANM